eukprot:TRINITY_DN35333_c0_g1_i1.p1 TRINITY_DN35333_c0_g1~~TRINITY_DN35333_c0_g1_i1.p1  ORF type:complete len:553 (+),score=107.94 TRINITY_DN35333_c0_g1_i1:450-2108(+)
MEGPQLMISQNVSCKRHKRRKEDREAKNDEAQAEEGVINEAQTEGGVIDEAQTEEGFDVAAFYKEQRKKRQELREKRREEMEEADRREQKRLESILFGNLYDPVVFGDEATDVAEDAEIEDSETKAVKISKERQPAWIDEEESEVVVDISKVNRLRKLRVEEDETLVSGENYVNRLRSHHMKLNRGTHWADLDAKDKVLPDSDEEMGREDFDDDIVRSNEELVVQGKQRLLPGTIEISRLTDANSQDPSDAVVQSVSFHRNGQMLLTAGLDKKLKFFQIDGKKNHKIQSVFIADLPIHTASFVADGSKVIASGRRKHFYSFDMIKGKLDRISCLIGREERSLESFAVSPDSNLIAFLGNEGYILLVSTKTNQLTGILKMNGSVRAVAFTHDGKQLLGSGRDGEIYHWDIGTRRCIHRGKDEGCIKGTALGVSHDSSLFAAGSDSGIVNIYNSKEFLGGSGKPLKAIDNLVTTIDNVKFNCDSQILAICSRMKRNGLKLVHLPSCTVFSNWPRDRTPLQYVHSFDFSPRGGFMAVGNAAGKVLLYKLHHYENA